jgi:hypothetical protein
MSDTERPSERAMRLAKEQMAIEENAVPVSKIQSTHAYATLTAERRRLARLKDIAYRRHKALSAQLEEHDAYLIKCLREDKLQSIRQRGYNFTAASRDTIKVADRDDFYGYATKKANWDLLTKHVVAEAVRERIRNGIKIPGILREQVPYLSVSKAAPGRKR